MTLKHSLAASLVLAALQADSTIGKTISFKVPAKVERGHIIPPHKVNSVPNSRVRMSKKRRIAMRDFSKMTETSGPRIKERRALRAIRLALP